MKNFEDNARIMDSTAESRLGELETKVEHLSLLRTTLDGASDTIDSLKKRVATLESRVRVALFVVVILLVAELVAAVVALHNAGLQHR